MERIKRLSLAISLITLVSCANYVPPNSVGCMHVTLDGPTTDSSLEADLVKLPDSGYEPTHEEVLELIQECNTSN